LPTFEFQLAKRAAWEVLNTDFAGAFAVTWIAVLFFWGLQSRRLVEAETKMTVVVEEARHTLRLAHKDAFRDYLEFVVAIQGQPLDPPRKPKASVKRPGTRDDAEETEQEIADREEKEFQEFRLVRKSAFDLAIGTPLEHDEELERMEEETERLKEFAPQRFFFAVSRPLAEFVELLRERGRLPAGELGQLWGVVADGTASEAMDAISKLADSAKSTKSN
jgi:hypothetical protein